MIEPGAVIEGLRRIDSCDPDVLHAHRTAWLESMRLPRMLGTLSLWLGAIAAVSVVLVPVGVPLLILGWWLRRRAAENVAAVEAAFDAFVRERLEQT